MVLLFENGFSGWGQFLQSFCRNCPHPEKLHFCPSDNIKSNMFQDVFLKTKNVKKCFISRCQPKLKKRWMRCVCMENSPGKCSIAFFYTNSSSLSQAERHTKEKHFYTLSRGKNIPTTYTISKNIRNNV